MTEERDNGLTTTRGRWQAGWTQVALGALALVVGFGVAAAPRLFGGGGERITNAARGNPRALPTESALSRPSTHPAESPVVSMPEAPAAPAATPMDAIDAFLGAEARGDFTLSFGFLAADDRATHQSSAAWTAAHGQFPVVRGYALGAVRITEAGGEVDGTVVLKPELDPVIGLVPGTATATWVMRPEDGGWRVAYSESTVTAQYPSADTAAAAARIWIADRTGCGARARAALLGTGALADALCAARGPVQVGLPLPLQPTESSDPFLAAYGPDVFSWAQVVPVMAPAHVGAVLAPLGSRWRVIGLVDLPALQTNPQQGAQKQ